ncbi:MAG: UDP-N-acetylglucosamine pyrophosphorylase [Clostridiales bacterium]|nr:UDP-N-acetylglucosamine pyrophosphorylase [Candidatus Equinaster intestinalis]
MYNELKTENLLDLSHTIAGELLKKHEFPWEVLPEIKEFIIKLQKELPKDEYDEISPQVFVAKDVKIAKTASISAPCIIGKGTEVRQCAFIRGSAIIGENCVIGNSVELKNCIIFDNVQVPHYNYVGDSVLGYRSHLGAGALTSNVKSDKTNANIRFFDEKIETGLRKFGAIVGDGVEVGCNSVLNPATVIGRGSRVYPLSFVRGYIPEQHIFKSPDDIVKIV